MNKSVGLLLLGLTFCMSFSGVAFAQTPAAGFSAGDKFTYTCNLLGTHNESLSWSPWTPEMNQSTWEITVISLNGTRTYYQLQILLANGTLENFPSQYIDLFSGGANGLNYMFLVGSNLNVGNLVYPGGPNYFVNDSLNRSYPSGSRSTNHVSFSTFFDYRNALIDKATGVMVEFNATYLDLAGTFKLDLIYSSLWAVSLSPTPTISTTPTTTSTPSTTPTTKPTTTPTTTMPSPTVPEFSSIAILFIVAFTGLCTTAILKMPRNRRRTNNIKRE